MTLRFFDFATRQVKPVVALANPKLNSSSVMTVSPDGRWGLFQQLDRDLGDILLVENLR